MKRSHSWYQWMILFNPTKNPAKNPAKNRNDGTWMAFGWWKDWQESGRNCPGGKPHFSSHSKMPQLQDSLNQDSGVSGFRIARLQAVSANSLTETGKELERIVETRIGILVLGFSGVFQGCFKLCFQRSYRWLISRDSWGFLRMSHGDFFFIRSIRILFVRIISFWLCFTFLEKGLDRDFHGS